MGDQQNVTHYQSHKGAIRQTILCNQKLEYLKMFFFLITQVYCSFAALRKIKKARNHLFTTVTEGTKIQEQDKTSDNADDEGENDSPISAAFHTNTLST